MTTILQVFIKFNQFMTSYFGHVHIHLTGGEKYVVRNVAKPGGLHRGSISTSATANPCLSSKIRAVWEKGVCLTLILPP